MTHTTFEGEVQFRRWSDSSTQGVQITFALPDSDDLAPLKGLEGKRFMAVLVAIGDDEMPTVHQKSTIPRKDTRGPLCREACDYCAMPEFRHWIEAVSPHKGVQESDAADYIRAICFVDSRKKLDTEPEAGRWFVNGIRVPFMKWQRAQRAA